MKNVASTFTILSFIWGGIALVCIFFDSPAKYPLVYISGLFSGIAVTTSFFRDGFGKRQKRENLAVP